MNKRAALDVDRRVALWLSMQHVQMRVEDSARTQTHSARDSAIRSIYNMGHLVPLIVNFVGSPSDDERKEQSFGLYRERTRVEMLNDGKWTSGTFSLSAENPEKWCINRDDNGSTMTCPSLAYLRRKGFPHSIIVTSVQLITDEERKLSLRRGKTRVEILYGTAWYKGTYIFFDDVSKKWYVQCDDDEEGFLTRANKLTQIRLEGQKRSLAETHAKPQSDAE